MRIKYGSTLDKKNAKPFLETACVGPKECKLKNYCIALNKHMSKDNFNTPIYPKVTLLIINVW